MSEQAFLWAHIAVAGALVLSYAACVAVLIVRGPS